MKLGSAWLPISLSALAMALSTLAIFAATSALASCVKGIEPGTLLIGTLLFIPLHMILFLGAFVGYVFLIVGASNVAPVLLRAPYAGFAIAIIVVVDTLVAVQTAAKILGPCAF